MAGRYEPRGGEPGRVTRPVPRPDPLPRRARAVATCTVVLLALWISGCATTGKPLSPDHGYPPDWPSLVALSEGLAELEGVYADEGVGVTDDGRRLVVRLSDLVPRSIPRKDADAAATPTCPRCVAIRVIPRGRGFLSSQRLRFTLPQGSKPRVFDAPSAGSVNSTLYAREGHGSNAIVGMAISGAEVRLTCAADGSLIAQLHESSSLMLLMVIPVGARSDYTWARFERHRD